MICLGGALLPSGGDTLTGSCCGQLVPWPAANGLHISRTLIEVATPALRVPVVSISSELLAALNPKTLPLNPEALRNIVDVLLADHVGAFHPIVGGGVHLCHKRDLNVVLYEER